MSTLRPPAHHAFLDNNDDKEMNGMLQAEAGLTFSAWLTNSGILLD